MKAIHIDSTARTIKLVDYGGLDDLKRMVGGYIEVATQWRETGDVCYVDEEGLFKKYPGGFTIPGQLDGLWGNGVIVGRELGPDTAETADPVITVEQVCAIVGWFSVGIG